MRYTWWMTGQSNAVYGNLADFELHRPSIRLLPEAYCRRNEAVILGRVDLKTDRSVRVGMLYPDKTSVLEDVAAQLELGAIPVGLNRYEIDRVLRFGFEEEPEDERDHILRVDMPPPTADSGVPELLDHLLLRGVERSVSDIHIEMFRENVNVRIRMDGILHEVFSHIHPGNVNEVVNRLKVISRLQLSERRRPQDGRFRATVLDGDVRSPVDFRVSIVPGPAGEDAVIRVLDARVGLVQLEQLGMPPLMQQTLLQLLVNPEGMVLVAGPTGSGKTSTLYSALSQVLDGTRKVVTAEDPIEYDVEGINQKQVSALMPMAHLLRSLLRHDPDVMLFGEVRDEETANIASRAANTGHLVLGTLHAADVIGSIERLRSLGMTDYEVSNVLLCVIGQRLVRKVCQSCKQPTIPSEMQSAILGDLLNDIDFVEGAGCDACNHTGYLGRTGLFEMLIVGEEMQDLIAEHAHRSQMRAFAREHGFQTLVEHGFEKVAAGVTTIEELVRVIPYRQLAQAAHEASRSNLLA